MTRRIGTVAAVAGASALLVLLGGCSAPPPDGAWVLTPISYDNRLEGFDVGGVTDVTYPMHLSPDGAGGVWGESAGSWLHLDADGATLRRFNLDVNEAPHASLIDHGALDADRIVVSAGESGIHLFDTAADDWEVLVRGTPPLGHLAVHDGDVYVVAFGAGEGLFDIRRFDPAHPDVLEPVSPPLSWSPPTDVQLAHTVALDVGPDGSLYIATRAERLVVGPDGEVVDRAPQDTVYPQVAVGPDGTVAWSGASASDPEVPVFVEGGSAEARAVVTRDADCGAFLVVGPGADGATLPMPCDAQGLAWVSPDAFVVSTGGEAGAVLVRVTLP